MTNYLDRLRPQELKKKDPEVYSMMLRAEAYQTCGDIMLGIFVFLFVLGLLTQTPTLGLLAICPAQARIVLLGIGWGLENGVRKFIKKQNESI